MRPDRLHQDGRRTDSWSVLENHPLGDAGRLRPAASDIGHDSGIVRRQRRRRPIPLRHQYPVTSSTSRASSRRVACAACRRHPLGRARQEALGGGVGGVPARGLTRPAIAAPPRRRTGGSGPSCATPAPPRVGACAAEHLVAAVATAPPSRGGGTPRRWSWDLRGVGERFVVYHRRRGPSPALLGVSTARCARCRGAGDLRRDVGLVVVRIAEADAERLDAGAALGLHHGDARRRSIPRT